jgi:hypothetical protein
MAPPVGVAGRKEVTTREVSYITFGFFTDEEVGWMQDVSLLHAHRSREEYRAQRLEIHPVRCNVIVTASSDGARPRACGCHHLPVLWALVAAAARSRCSSSV